MEYQKIINLVDKESTQLSEFRTKNWVQINDDRHGTYNTENLNFKTAALKPRFCDYSDPQLLARGTILVANTKAADANRNNPDEKVIFKNCAPLKNCITKTNNTEVHNTRDIDIVMLMYNLIESSDNYTKTFGSLFQYYRDGFNIIEMNQL